MGSSQSEIDAAFALLVAAATKGERCPQNEPFGPILKDVMSALVRAGRVHVDICARNWRIVTILQGEHAGKSTAPDPRGVKPWKRISKEGTIVLRRAAPRVRQFPSKPGTVSQRG